MKDSSYNWISELKESDSNVSLLSLQVANCTRLRSNDIVCIFDEVGSGKTISSGLMTLDFLYNNPQKHVLVVTTNALVKE